MMLTLRNLQACEVLIPVMLKVLPATGQSILLKFILSKVSKILLPAPSQFSLRQASKLKAELLPTPPTLLSCVNVKSKYLGAAVKSMVFTPTANMNLACSWVPVVTVNSLSVCWVMPYCQAMLALLKVSMTELEKMTMQMTIKIAEQMPPVKVRYRDQSRYLKNSLDQKRSSCTTRPFKRERSMSDIIIHLVQGPIRTFAREITSSQDSLAIAYYAVTSFDAQFSDHKQIIEMEEYRQTNPLELHVNKEIQAELQRETLRHSMQAHLHAIYQHCASLCIKDVQPLSGEQKNCLLTCYTQQNIAYHSHIRSLLAQ